MALTATPAQLKTYDDLRAIPDDGNRYELIFGEIVMSPAPRTKHQLVLSNLYDRMSQFTNQKHSGRVMFAPVDVKFSPYNVVEPDLLFISRQNRQRLGEEYVDGAPDIVVEVLSPSNRMQDLIKKAVLYADHMVPEYWIIDPDAETITVNQLLEGQYVAVHVKDGIARSTVLVGFEVSTSDLFVEPEWMKAAESEAE